MKSDLPNVALLNKREKRQVLNRLIKNEEYLLCCLSSFKEILTKDEIILIYLEIKFVPFSWVMDDRISNTLKILW